MTVAPVREMLLAHRAQLGLKEVGNVLGLLDAIENLSVGPAAFVVRTGSPWSRDSAGSSEVRQESAFNFDIVTGFMGVSLPGASEQVDEVLAAIEIRLVGWMHPTYDSPAEFRGDNLARLDWIGGRVFYRQSFSCWRLIRRSI